MVVGIVGNTAVFIVYIHRNHRTTANIFIMYLAGTDLMACGVIHPYVIYKLFHNYSQTWTGACKIFEFAIHASLSISGLTLLALAIDRYLAICRPVKFLDFHKHIYKIILATFTVGIVGSTPLLVFYGSKAEKILVNDYLFIQYKCEYTEEYNGSVMTGYSVFVVTAFLLEVIAIVVLYKQVAVVAYRSRRRVNPMPEKPDGHSGAGSMRRAPLKFLSSTNSSKKQSRKLSLLSSKISIEVNVYPKETPKLNVSAPSSATKEELHVPRICSANVNNSFHSEKKVTETSICAFTSEPTRKVSEARICAIIPEPRVQRLNRTKNLSSGLKAAKLLFLVTAIYFLSWLPFFILRIIHTVDSHSWYDRSPSRQVLEHFLNHCFYINNSANPIIYSAINKQFRLECWKLLKKLRVANR